VSVSPSTVRSRKLTRARLKQRCLAFIKDGSLPQTRYLVPIETRPARLTEGERRRKEKGRQKSTRQPQTRVAQLIPSFPSPLKLPLAEAERKRVFLSLKHFFPSPPNQVFDTIITKCAFAIIFLALIYNWRFCKFFNSLDIRIPRCSINTKRFRPLPPSLSLLIVRNFIGREAETGSTIYPPSSS